jgi:hypothetical protein
LSSALARKVSWDSDLQAYLDAQRHEDRACAYFTDGAVEAVTGTSLLPKFRGRMTWAREHLAEAVSEVLDERPVAFARNGDLVMKDGCLGVCHGRAAFFMGLHEGQAGTTIVPTLQCDKAWTVG